MKYILVIIFLIFPTILRAELAKQGTEDMRNFKERYYERQEKYFGEDKEYLDEYDRKYGIYNQHTKKRSKPKNEIRYHITPQYAGKKHKKTAKSKQNIKDFKFYIGFGFMGNEVSDISLKSSVKSNGGTGTGLTRKTGESNVAFKKSIGFSAAAGYVHPIGLKLETEYIRTDSNMRSVSGDDFLTYTIDTDEDVVVAAATSTASDGLDYTIGPEIQVNAVMFNILFDKHSKKSKINPYFGVGVGYGDFAFICKQGDISKKEGDIVPAMQVKLGITRKTSKAGEFYFGYRVFKSTSPISFVRDTVYVQDVNNSYNLNINTEYDYTSHSIDTGFRLTF